MARILIIDDDPQIQELFSRVLSDRGHEVETAMNGREGLRIQRSEPADLIICDLVMPEMDGLEVIRELRHDESRAPLIAVTGGSYVASEENLRVAGHLGATRIVSKPVSLGALAGMVDQLLAEAVGE